MTLQEAIDLYIDTFDDDPPIAGGGDSAELIELILAAVEKEKPIKEMEGVLT